MLAGLLLPWISTSLVEDSTSRGVDLVAIWVPTVISALLSIGFAGGWWRTGSVRFSTYAALAAGFTLLLTALTLAAIEASGNLIPTSLLPSTVRRSAGVLGAGAGAWTTLAGAALVAAAASGPVRGRFQLLIRECAADRRRAGALLALVVLVVLVAWLRYQPWLDSAALGKTLTVNGQAAPWVGPGSLLALCLLVGAFVALAFSRFQEAGLIVAGAGWLISFFAAITVIAGESLAQLRLDDLLEGSLGVQTVTFHVALAAWGTYVCGIAIATVGGFLVCCRNHLEVNE
jgi:hypothetical protein